MQPNQCFLCGNKDDLRSLSDSTYDKLRDVIRYRKFKKRQYGEVVLPRREDAYYHTNCYKKVSTITVEDRDEMEKLLQEDQVTEEIEANRTCFDPTKCVFCDDTNKSRESLRTRSKQDKIDEIKRHAEAMKDTCLLRKIKDQSAIKYHPSCILMFFRKNVRKDPLADASEYKEKRKIHDKAFEHLCTFVQEEILANEKVLLLTRIFEEYKHIYHELAPPTDEEFTYPARHIENKLLHHFGDQIQSHLSQTHNRKVIYKSNPNLQKLIEARVEDSNDRSRKWKIRGYDLREELRSSLQVRFLPDSVNTKHIFEGECQIPEFLYTFVEACVLGPHSRDCKSSDEHLKIESICSDIIFAMSKGKIKPAKQLKVGLTVKALTSSRRLLTLLNRTNQSISYSTADELENTMLCNIYRGDYLLPPGMIVRTGVKIHLVWDNKDDWVETASGKDTLHDTNGICYQIMGEEQSNVEITELPGNLDESTCEADGSSHSFRDSREWPDDGEIPRECSEGDFERDNISFTEVGTANHSHQLHNDSHTASTDNSLNTISSSTSRKRKRFDGVPFDIADYIGKPEAITTLMELGSSLSTKSCSELSIKNILHLKPGELTGS
ncbi:hypothetical protein QAD02_021595 [Eretmocerus hayati]|uniref:Uncharacterized protein n=1 Tax=Eretmocerus hayati TaxID=131215 RepID=A0ACC2PQX5_9HYME|nr:hypothetical protein QAD02_021595 [Eretmocerus hayati]